MLNKKLILISISTIILIATAVVLINLPKNQEPVDKLSTVLADSKKVLGMDLNLSPERVKWNTNGKEMIYSGKGCSYLDALNAPKISDLFNNVCNFLETSGFKNNPENSDINDADSTTKRYIKDEIVCNIAKKNNSNSTSSISLACANVNNIAYNFNTGEGSECQIDSDCGVFTDACDHKRVCRNLKYDFYNTCSNPSQKVQDIDFSVSKCQCINNQCSAKKSAVTPTILPSPSK